MRTKKLGNSGISLPPLMLGGNVFGWTVDPAAAMPLLDAALDAGLNAIDTAEAYSFWIPGHSGGESEAVIGVWLKSRKNRDKVIVATKTGMDMGAGRSGLSKQRIRQAVEASLIRLQTDYIDLYQAHFDDPKTPLEETLETFGALIKEGKVRAIGASNYSAARLHEALDVSEKNGLPRYQSLQPHYNLAERPVYEDELEPLCESEHLGVISYFSLASGFLTGKYRSAADLENKPRRRNVEKYVNPRGFKIVAALEAQAKRLDAKPGEVALAWLMARPSVTAPIASATSLAQLQDLVKATEVRLDEAAIKALDEASAG